MNLTQIFCIILSIKLVNGEIATANNQFGLKLYSALASKMEGDFVLSPFPLSTLFALIYSGAGSAGTTRKEIQNIFQFAEDPSEVIRDYSRVIRDFEILKSLENIQPLILLNDLPSLKEEFITVLKDLKIETVTSSLNETVEIDQPIVLLNGSFSLQKEFDTIVKENLNTVSPLLNKTIELVLKWLEHPLENQTICKFLKATIKTTRFGLLSKSFFQGSWVTPFNPIFTKPSPFFIDEMRSTQVETMFQRAQVPYAELEELDSTAIALPYQTTDEDISTDFYRLELIILLPNSRNGLAELENKLKSFPFSLLTRQFLDKKDLYIYLPRLNVSAMMDLSTIISEDMGIESLTNPDEIEKWNIFNRTKGITKISNILHFVQFSVNEGGSGGVVPITNNSTLFHNSPPSFRVNKPFIGFLYDQERHIILNIFRKTM